jgi:uncharacterized protein (DUF302 family)
MKHIFRAAILAVIFTLPAAAQPAGLVTQPSAHGVRQTLDRFAQAVREAGWVVFTEIDHAAAAEAVPLPLRPRVVILFGNPRAGTPPMRAQPTLALDLPMRALVWEDDAGRVFLTRSSGEDIAGRVFARHGIMQDNAAQAGTEAFLSRLSRRATE